MTQPLLEVQGVSLHLGDRRILDDISFSLQPGAFVGLIGPNGAGKTTLLRVVLGLLAPGSGRVLVDGRKVGGQNRSIGYVPQKIRLDLDVPLRGRDLVELGLDGGRWGVPLPSRARRERINAMLEAVGAWDFADEPVGRLSGGQQQRLLIAHALVSEPRLLLLDEPLSNLDIKSANEVVQLVGRMTHEKRIAAMLVAHDMNPLLGVMDQVVYLANGHAIIGGVDDVIQSDVLSALYGYDVEVIRAKGRVLVVSGNDQPHHAASDNPDDDAAEGLM